MSLGSLAVPFYYNPNPARVKRNEERIPFRPRRRRLGHLPQGGGKRECPRFPEGGSGRRPIGGSTSRKAGHHNSFIGRRPLILLHYFFPFSASLCGGISRASASRPWLPRPSSDRGRRSPAATRPRSFEASAAVPDPLRFPYDSRSFPPVPAYACTCKEVRVVP